MTTPAPLFQKLPRYALRPVPLALLRPLFQRIADHIAARHPRLFDRLGPHSGKSFLIAPTNLPFVLLLRPDPVNPQLELHRDATNLTFQASMTGSFLNLLRLLDGSSDGDALFFSRSLRVEGDTEAIVCLRNALDDIEGSIAGDVAGLFGPPGRAALSFLRQMEVAR